MPRLLPIPTILGRDGTSQRARVAAALDPSFVAVDERTPRDWLALVSVLARALRFVDPERPGSDLDWRGLLGEGVDLDRLAAIIKNPEMASAGEAAWCGRPHVALLLTFFDLLGEAQAHVNGLTRRHLEFYVGQVLRIQPRPATPDRVHVLLRPARGVAAVELAAGTELVAGVSASGAPRIYRLDRSLVVHRAQVAELRSIHVDQRVTGIREARERRDPGTDPSDRFVRMFNYVLGEPRPGGPMPLYAGEVVGIQTLVRLGQLARFSAEILKIDLHEFRSMIVLRLRRAAADAEWARINELLERAGRRRTANPGWALAPANPRRFVENLAKAIGAPVNASLFDGLPEVESIDDLAVIHVRDPGDADIAAFIRDRLYLEVGEFDEVMALKRRSDGEWAQVNRTLERAGQLRRGDRSYRLAPVDPTDFAANFAAAVGPGFVWPAGVSSPETYHQAILALEAYFNMSAESFAYVVAAAPGGTFDPTPRQWDRIDGMLTAAYQARVREARRAALAAVRAGQGYRAAVGAALGVAVPDESAVLPLIMGVVGQAADLAAVAEIEAAIAAADGDESVISDAQWSRFVIVLEGVQRSREGLPDPVPRRMEWRNLYAHPDATRVIVEPGVGEQPYWRTFGVRPAERPGAPAAASFGWALASPVLALAEGTRRIIVTLGFAAAGWDGVAIAAALQAGALAVEVTTKDGWIAPTSVTVVHGDYAALSQVVRPIVPALPAIQLVIDVGVDAEPIAALAAERSGIATEEPALRLVMRQIWDAGAGQYVTLYEPFRPLTLAAASLRVEVSGLGRLAVENDDGTVDPEVPFLPFGAAPAIGARCKVTHPELRQKPLAALTFRIAWMGAPADLAAHYDNYDVTINNTNVLIKVTAVDRRRGFVLAEGARLFADDARAERAIALNGLPPALGGGSPDRHFVWELTPIDLQHAEYPRAAARAALALAAKISAGQPVNPADHQVSPPYTPTIKKLTVEYRSSVEVVPGAQAAAGRDRLFHVRPFGSHPIVAEEGGAHRFLPAYEDGGELYIGLRDVAAPQQISLLMQMAEGSANPEHAPVPVVWSYLDGDRWLSLHDGDVLGDSTRGLINTGIVELRLPAAAPSSQLRSDLYWIRVAIPRHTDSVCGVVAIRAQAASATHVDAGDDPTHHEQPLAAGSIGGLLRHDPRIGGVDQPYTSFGGRASESPEQLANRTAERLRHKRRALTAWDYERLALAAVPRIYKIKCLPADPGEHPEDPGRVELVVIPDIRDQRPFDPFEPKAPADLLAEVERAVAPCCPPFAHVRARNARFVAIKARFAVRFVPGSDVGFCQRRLGEELCRFLSPWAYAEGADVAIGGRVYANSIINFVDGRDYVDYVAAIKLFRSHDGVDFALVPPPADKAEGYSVGTERPDEVLVAAREHDIDILTEARYDTDLLSGINYMKIELDYVVG